MNAVQYRWLKWLATTVVIVAVGSILLPIIRTNPEGIHSYFASVPSWQRHLVCLLLSIVFVSLLFGLLSPRWAHFRAIRKIPPAWSSWVVAAVIVFILDSADLVQPGRDFVWHWIGYGAGSIVIVGAWYGFLSGPSRSARPDDTRVSTTTIEELLRDWTALEKWLQRDALADDDLIGNRRVARRLAVYLRNQGGTIGLVGPFGSGKSSIINWLEQEIAKSNNSEKLKILICKLSCWGFEDSTMAVHVLLGNAVQTVAAHADCFSIRHLPESYRKMFSAPGDWVRNAADLILGADDPISEFRRLSEILESLNARLVVVVEDVDRTDSSRFDRQEVLALLHRLKNDFGGVSFILAAGNSESADIDFAKLCDHIELLRDFDAGQVSAIVNAVREHCLSTFRDILTNPPNDNPWNPTQYLLLSGFDIVPLTTAVARLLRTPRALKHALSRTYRTWTETLHGEIDFDHLFGVNVLRFGAPRAFDFLIRNWDRLQTHSSSWTSDRGDREQIRARLRDEWRQTTDSLDWDGRSALELIVFLVAEAGEWLRDHRGLFSSRAQGVQLQRYWLRAVNEDLGPAESNDQEVLREMREWQRTKNPSAPLVERLATGGDAVDVWEYFAANNSGLDANTLLQFAAQVLNRLRSRFGSRASQSEAHEAFVAIWRRANRQVPRDRQSRDWLENELGQSIKVSLPLVNDLFCYWASTRNGIILPEDRKHLRSVIINLAHAQFRDGPDLIRVTHPDEPYDLYQLVFPPNGDDGVLPNEALSDWRWFGPILLDALRREPGMIAMKIACLISQRTPGTDLHLPMVSVVENRLTEVFGDSTSELFDYLAGERDRRTGSDREFLDQVLISGRMLTGPRILLSDEG